MAKKEPVKKVGRPTVYDAKYCDMLIEHMKEGYSFEAFGASPICVHKDTLYQWVEKHADFADAKKRAELESLKWWEKQGIKGLYGDKNNQFNAAVWIFNMKNRHKWRDNKDIEVSKIIVDPLKEDLKKMSTEELLKLAKSKGEE